MPVQGQLYPYLLGSKCLEKTMFFQPVVHHGGIYTLTTFCDNIIFEVFENL
jgi:hypothetical protein